MTLRWLRNLEPLRPHQRHHRCPPRPDQGTPRTLAGLCFAGRLQSGAEAEEFNMIKQLLILIAAGTAMLAAAGCNTVRGAGEDLQSASDEVRKEM